MITNDRGIPVVDHEIELCKIGLDIITDNYFYHGYQNTRVNTAYKKTIPVKPRAVLATDRRLKQNDRRFADGIFK